MHFFNSRNHCHLSQILSSENYAKKSAVLAMKKNNKQQVAQLKQGTSRFLEILKLKNQSNLKKNHKRKKLNREEASGIQHAKPRTFRQLVVHRQDVLK